MLNSPRFASLILVVVLLFTACGDDQPERVGGGGTGCRDEIGLRATVLPGGFKTSLEEGPGGGKEPVKDTVNYHWNGPSNDKYIDVYRGTARNKLKGAKTKILGKNGRIGKIPGGLGAKVKLGRGTCTRYQLEAFGVSEADFKKVVAGLERVANPDQDSDE